MLPSVVTTKPMVLCSVITSGADLRRHIEGDFPGRPRGLHHPRLFVFYVPDGTGKDIPHTVDHPHRKATFRRPPGFPPHPLG